MVDHTSEVLEIFSNKILCNLCLFSVFFQNVVLLAFFKETVTYLSWFCPFEKKLCAISEFYAHNKWNQWFKSNIFSKNTQLFQFYLGFPIFYYC